MKQINYFIFQRPLTLAAGNLGIAELFSFKLNDS